MGASNLTYAFPTLLASLRGAGRWEVYAAHGHGRSYGQWSRVAGRALPGIAQCRLWENWDAQPPAGDPPVALITDVGNDLLYGVEVATLLEWVEGTILRLTQQHAQIVMTLLPMHSLQTLSAWRFHLTKAFFFPTSRFTHRRMQQDVIELNTGLRRIGESFGAALVEPHEEWYGFDPIHIRRSRRVEAWQRIVSTWQGFEETVTVRRGSPAGALKTWTLRPAERRLFGIQQQRVQPVIDEERLKLWLY